MSNECSGKERERQVREIAAKLGVADFVYSAPQVQKGPGQREPSGDGLLLVGAAGAILQVKTRDPKIGAADTREKATTWIRKNAIIAVNQGRGSRRELARRKNLGLPMEVYPIRSSDMTLSAKQWYALNVEGSINDWPILVIIDHPKLSPIDRGFQNDVVYFSFADWQALQRRLRLISATLDYVRRIQVSKIHVQLGHESSRYYSFYLADKHSVAGATAALPYLIDTEDFDELGFDLFSRHHRESMAK